MTYRIYLSMFVSAWVCFPWGKLKSYLWVWVRHVPLCCHFAVAVLLLLSFSKIDLCFKVNVLVSEERVLHNRQIWPEAPRAANLSVLSPQITLMWNNLVFCLWCFSFPFAVLLLYYHLSYPELTSKSTEFSQAHQFVLHISFWLDFCNYY